MKSLAQVKKQIKATVKPVEVSNEKWQEAQAWASHAWQTQLNSQRWNHTIVLPHSSCLAWFIDEDGCCIVDDWNFITIASDVEVELDVLEVWLAELLNQQEWLDASQVALQIAMLTNEPKNWVNAGALSLKAETLKGALQILRTASQKFPAYADAYGVKAQVYFKLGWFDQAIDQLDTAITFQPASSEWWYLRSQLQWKLGQRASAVRTLKHACKLPAATIKMKQALADLQLKMKSYGEAWQLIHELQQEDATNGMTWLLLARWADVNNEPIRFVKEYYQLAGSLGAKVAEDELQYFLFRAAQRTKLRHVA